MDRKQTQFLLSVNIKRDDGNALVFYKQDGRRFENEQTIKMKVETPYNLVLTFRPPQKINSAFLRGEHLEVKKEESNEDVSRYILKWDNGDIGITKKNKRDRFPLIMDVQNVGTLELSFQFKFYGANDTEHSAWGKCLHQIDYNCAHKPGNSFVEIQSVIYK